MRLRRARCLVCYWHEGDFIAHPYLGGSPRALPSEAAEILAAFDEWTTPEEAAKTLSSYDSDSVAEAAGTLREHALLLTERSPEAERDEEVARHWGPWAPEASFFHYATQDSRYEELTEEGRYALVTDGRPALFTSHPEARRMLLPRTPARLDAPLGETLYRRRTHRSFGSRPVPQADLAALLATTFGPVDFRDAGGFGALMRRTSPSGGARHELEAYVGVRRVAGVAPGWYHYNALEHSLELLAEGCTGADLASLGGDQSWMGEASFVVVLAAVIERMLVKYRSPRAYRVCLLDAGHFGQTFVLAATAMGLGPFQTGAFDDGGVTERLGLDGTTVTPLYMVGAGAPGDVDPFAPPSADSDTFARTTLTRHREHGVVHRISA
ncbi:SagB/ThcOx family dehydrogenase [Streptomyces sp. GESEQ-35]|uniref:SagB/ThcOx family dehydrogenase n=1 Tax=Streptomyces sp. GESEQ-35 TaxID=2812657 RepID=UPI001FF12FC7|nr:SagB/ThcOx family dehydrogenase [Streptomyces sp. GESEQ-35]